MSGRLLVLGDIHGADKALHQVLERSLFDWTNDRLIFLGDVADGWPETKACVETLLSIPKLIHLLGNHDDWVKHWINTGRQDYMWVMQGGRATLDSYGSLDDVPATHKEYFRTAKYWHVEDNRVFLHAGWDYNMFTHPVQDSPDNLYWNRDLWYDAVGDQHRADTYGDGNPRNLTRFDEVYVGHTTTYKSLSTVPIQACEVWNLDQGAGWEGKLSIMDVNTKEFWQSDVVTSLYPGVRGRKYG